jgi:hypothetical protein
VTSGWTSQEQVILPNTYTYTYAKAEPVFSWKA